MRILIADDDLILRKMLSFMIENLNHSVEITTNGKETWEVLQKPDAPSMVIIDWNMPYMTGLEVVRNIRAMKSSKYTYVIMVTGMTDKEHAIAGFDAGVDDFLHKPFNIEELRARIQVGVRTISNITKQKTLEFQLSQAHKLEAVGQLAAGIAHEINTPAQYVGDNSRFLKESFQDLSRVLLKYETLLKHAKTGTITKELIDEVDNLLEEADMEYLMEEIPTAVNQSIEGIERVSSIVLAMKEFSHPGSKNKTLADINKAIKTTTTVCRNEWKYAADLTFDLSEKLPMIPCFPGELNQVFLNIIVNASHALIEKNSDSNEKGIIKISTRTDKEQVTIRISDNGPGIPKSIQDRIMEPFFTTKEVGKGTGQGLAIARATIVNKHHGKLTFETSRDHGTTFIITLPIQDNFEKGDEND